MLVCNCNVETFPWVNQTEISKRTSHGCNEHGKQVWNSSVRRTINLDNLITSGKSKDEKSEEDQKIYEILHYSGHHDNEETQLFEHSDQQ
jgi:hypothetical protein